MPRPTPRSRPASPRTSSASNRRGRAVLFRRGAHGGHRIVGLAVHIGSQLTDIAPFAPPSLKMAELAQTLRKAGLTMERIDLGGGLGIAYRDEATIDLEAYAALVKEVISPLGTRSRSSRAQHRRQCRPAGVARHQREGGGQPQVRDRRRGDERPDPARLYDAYHGIIPVAEPASDAPVDATTWSGRSARPATASPSSGPCRRSNRGIWWPSQLREPMVGHVLDLQHPAAGGRGPGPRRPVRRGPAAAIL